MKFHYSQEDWGRSTCRVYCPKSDFKSGNFVTFRSSQKKTGKFLNFLGINMLHSFASSAGKGLDHSACCVRVSALGFGCSVLCPCVCSLFGEACCVRVSALGFGCSVLSSCVYS